MKIKLKPDIAELYTSSDPTAKRFANWKYVDELKKMAGQTVQVDTTKLLPNAFVLLDNGEKIPASFVEPVIDDVRPDNKRCEWCGRSTRKRSRKCPYCGEQDFIGLEPSERRMSLKQIIRQAVTPQMILNMYGRQAVQRYAQHGDQFLNSVQRGILLQLKDQMVKQLQYAIIRQGRYMAQAITDKTAFFAQCVRNIARDGTPTQRFVYYNDIFDWRDVSQHMQTAAYVYDMYALGDPKVQQFFKQMLQPGYIRFRGDLARFQKRMSKQTPNFRRNWQTIKGVESVRPGMLRKFLIAMNHLRQYAYRLSTSNFGNYVDVMGDNFRQNRLRIVRQFFDNPKLQTQDFVNLFKYGIWGRQFGGQRWYNIGQQYIKLKAQKNPQNIKQSIDHINDLIHNTGSILSKFKYSKQLMKALQVKKHAKNYRQLRPYITDHDINRAAKEYRFLIDKDVRRARQLKNSNRRAARPQRSRSIYDDSSGIERAMIKATGTPDVKLQNKILNGFVYRLQQSMGNNPESQEYKSDSDDWKGMIQIVSQQQTNRQVQGIIDSLKKYARDYKRKASGGLDASFGRR